VNIVDAAMQAKTSQAIKLALIYFNAAGVLLLFRNEPVRKLIINADGRANLEYEAVS